MRRWTWRGVGFRDLQAIQESCPEQMLLNSDRVDALRDAAARFTPEQIRRAVAAIPETKHRIDRNANPLLALEAMGLTIRN